MGKLYRDLVRTHSKAKGSARALLNILADYANDEGLAWPTRETMANDTGLSERTVTRCLQTLCDDGRLSIEENAVGGRGRVPIYRILFPECVKGDNLSEQRESTCHPLDAERVTNGHIKGDNLSIKGDKFAEIPSYARSEPQLTETKEPDKEIAADAASPTPPALPKPDKPKRSRKSQNPPSSEAPPREPTEWQEFVGAFCWLCFGHKEVRTLTKEQRGAVLSEAKMVSDEGYTILDLKEWYKRVWGQSWQYKRNSTARPQPADVRSTIAQLRAEVPEGFEVAAVPALTSSFATSKTDRKREAFANVERILQERGLPR